MLSPSDTNPLVLSFDNKMSSTTIGNNIIVSVKLDEAEIAISDAERSVMMIPESMENNFGLEDIANETMKREQSLILAGSLIKEIELDFKRNEILAGNLERIACCKSRMERIKKRTNEGSPVKSTTQGLMTPSKHAAKDDCGNAWFCNLL